MTISTESKFRCEQVTSVATLSVPYPRTTNFDFNNVFGIHGSRVRSRFLAHGIGRS